MATRETLLETIRGEHERWRALVAEVGEDRMEEPGAIGSWSFKELVGHLNGWTERRIRRLEAGPDGEATNPWPADLNDDDDVDAVNAWIDAQYRDRPLRAVLDEADRNYTRLAAAVAALPEEDVTSPGRFRWLDGQSLADADPFEHLHDEHEADIRAWLAAR